MSDLANQSREDTLRERQTGRTRGRSLFLPASGEWEKEEELYSSFTTLTPPRCSIRPIPPKGTVFRKTQTSQGQVGLRKGGTPGPLGFFPFPWFRLQEEIISKGGPSCYFELGHHYIKVTVRVAWLEEGLDVQPGLVAPSSCLAQTGYAENSNLGRVPAGTFHHSME